MKNLYYLMLVLNGPLFAQSIQLNEEPVKVAPALKKSGGNYLSYVEFRDAEMSNIWMLIETQSGLKVPVESLSKTKLSLRLEDVSWAQLLKIVRNQATP